MKSSISLNHFSEEALDRVVEMAWEDRTPFDAIERQFGLSESSVITLMRQQLTARGWRRWRTRVQGRATKHAALSAVTNTRFKSAQQRPISHNKLSKR